MGRLSDAALDALLVDLSAKGSALPEGVADAVLYESVTAALAECQRRHAARVAITAPRVEARAS